MQVCIHLHNQHSPPQSIRFFVALDYCWIILDYQINGQHKPSCRATSAICTLFHPSPLSLLKSDSTPRHTCNNFLATMMKLTPQQEVIASIASYSFCSGTLVLLNKLTLHFLPFPSLVVSFQLLACIVLIYGAQFLGYIQVDPIKWEYVKPYLLYIFFFSTGVYCNMRSLSEANVETVIVFRALSPIIVAFMDTLCLGREWPTIRSWIGLLTLVLGAYGYASFDVKFQTQGYSAYFWPTLYTLVIASEMVRVCWLHTLTSPGAAV